MKSSLLLPLHRAAGARLAAGEPPQLLTYGDVPAEYRAGTEGCVLFDVTDRERIEIGGADAPAFLHRILANDVRGLQGGSGQRNLLLSAKGKVLFDFDLFREGEGLWLSVAPGRAAALLQALYTYLFAEKVTLRDTSAGHAPLALCGPRAAEVLQAVFGTVLPRADHAFVRTPFLDARATLASLPVAGSAGFLVDVGPERVASAWQRLCTSGAQPAGVVARDCLRVEAGAAETGADIDENVYPQEARLERAFSLTKGCYIGQEVVAKIDTYGGLNKRLVALKLAHDDPVAHGTRLYREENGEWRDLGVVTSWAYSFVLDTGLVLAYVKRRHQAPGTVFRVGEGDARATIVPLPVRPGALAPTGEFEAASEPA